MRVLHLLSSIDPAFGGPSECIRAMLRFSPDGYQQEVATVDDPAAPFLRDLPDSAVHAFGPRTSVYGYNPRMREWLRQNRGQYDYVMLHGLWNYANQITLEVLDGHVPYVSFPHGMLDPYFKRISLRKHLKKWAFWLPIQYWVLRRSECVLFTSTTEAEDARKSFWLHRWNSRVVSYGTMGPEGDPADKLEAFFALQPELRGKRYLLYLSRIHRKKGCDLLLEAFRQIAPQHPDLHLVMAGPDPENWRTELQSTFGDLNSRVHWPGMLRGDAKWGAFYGCEAFILPSHQENFGIVVSEALACGRAVLLSDKVNIAPEILADGAGLMEPDTPAGTLRLLQRWLALTPAEQDAMRQKARPTYEARYNMRTNAMAIARVMEPGS